MYHRFIEEEASLSKLLDLAQQRAKEYLANIRMIAPDIEMPTTEFSEITENGIGTEASLNTFFNKYGKFLTASAGPRYWGYVVGGHAPAGLVGDWITSAIDQLPAGDSVIHIELESLRMLRSAFGLPDSFHGCFTSGASMSEFVGLATARDWVMRKRNLDSTKNGLFEAKPIKIFSANPHSSIYKAIALLGMGRAHLVHVESLANSESIDILKLEAALKAQNGDPCIVVANAGTVNTGAFDDLEAVSMLKEKYTFWMHVDGAFGAYAACSPQYSALVNGWEKADSIAIDAHKWMNVPQDCGIHFNKHLDIHTYSFGQSHADYLDKHSAQADSFINMTPELTRKIRGIPVWFFLQAYGTDGLREMIERHGSLTKILASRIDAHPGFVLLADPILNICCFTLANDPTKENVQKYLSALMRAGKVFLTPTSLGEVYAIRAALCNWMTTKEDLEIAWKSMVDVLENFGK